MTPRSTTASARSASHPESESACNLDSGYADDEAHALELDSQLCFVLDAAARLLVKLQRAALDQLGLTYPQYLTMLVLWAWDRDKMPKPTVRALSERLDLDSSSVTPLLKRLERRDLVIRSVPPHNRRELYIQLTEAGRALRERAQHVPVLLLEQVPLPASEIILLRDHVNRLRAELAGDNRSEFSHALRLTTVT